MTGQAVTLPTGDVLAVGGNSSGNDTKGTPVMTPELYSTATNTWASMADIARRRTYHSVAALLPDGRVWSAGSSFDEVQEPNGQFFSPPYLFRKDGSGQLATRPTATDAPASVARGPVVLDRDEQPVEHRLRLVHPHGRDDAPGERGPGVREAERDPERAAASR